MSVPLDTLAGGGVTGMLVTIMVVFLRRTKEVDERHERFLNEALDTANKYVERLERERDAALRDIAVMREKYEALLVRERDRDQ